jgi:CRP-like cAMP-binding protein
MSEGSIAKFATCFELIILAPNADIEASKRLPGRNGDFFVIGDGQLDVSVKVPSVNKKTGYIREVLCSKKQGDILYVPAVESLAGAIHHNSSKASEDASLSKSSPFNGEASRLRRTSAQLASLLSMRSRTVRSSIPEGALVERGLADMHKFSVALKEDQFGAPQKNGGAISPKSKLKNQKADDSMIRIERLVKHLDMTTITAPYGATLLRLDKNRFDAFQAAVLKVHKNEYREDSSLVTKSLPWSKHSLDNSGTVVDSEIAFASSAPPLPDFELMRVMMASNIQDYLKRIPFLDKVPMSRIQMLGEMSQFEVLPPDQIVCNEGEEGDRVFVVIFGQLAVYAKKEPTNGDKLRSPQGFTSLSPGRLLGTLGQGDHFGEMSVLADIPRQATVQSKTSCLLISISRSHFRNLMKVVPDVGDSIQTVMRLYMLSKFFQSLLYSETLTKMDQQMLESRLLVTCHLVEAPTDLQLIEEGQDADSFYFVYHGRVVAYQRGKPAIGINDEPRIHLGIMGPGSYFGEISILTETNCRASVVTASRCMLLRVAKEDFRDTWCTIPGFRAEFLVRIFGKLCRLEHILNHSQTRRAFEDFADKEHASENVIFVDAVSVFKAGHATRGSESNLEMAEKIIHDYLDQDAARQVNVPQAMVKRCHAEYEAMASKIDPTRRNPPLVLFDACRDEVVKMMEMGSLSRFKKSSQYLAILTKLRAYEHQVDASDVACKMVDKDGRRVSFAPPPTYDQQRTFIMESMTRNSSISLTPVEEA